MGNIENHLPFLFITRTEKHTHNEQGLEKKKNRAKLHQDQQLQVECTAHMTRKS